MPGLRSKYVLEEQTLVPGRELVTISGMTLSLSPSGTALIVNGETSSVDPVTGSTYTAVVPQPVTTIVALKRGPGSLET